MSKKTSTSIPRRDFLKTAAGVVGASMLAPTSAVAGMLGGPQRATVATTLSVGFWDGAGMISANALSGGDASLQEVVVTLRGYGPAGKMKGLLALGGVPGTRVGFFAWRAAPVGVDVTKFTMKVDSEGIGFVPELVGAEATEQIQFRVARGKGPKLREGYYVLTTEPVQWAGLGFEPALENGPVVGAGGMSATFQYVVLKIERV